MLDFKAFNENIEFSEHEYYLPTYEECRAICDEHDNFLFYETKHDIDGFVVSIFNYRLAHFTHFEKPLENSKAKAYEMRGLSFVWNKDGSLYKRFLLLDKFFNIDQTPCSAYSVLKEYKIRNIFNKEDGSIASFIMLPNGVVKGKSKASFESDQAIEIQKIYDQDENIRRVVDNCLNKDIMPVFEYVSPTNRIVVPYANSELILLRLRDNNTGEYLDVDDIKEDLNGVTVAESYDDLGLDELVELKSIQQDKEGWIIQFTNGKMAKFKTDWYCERHKLFTDELNRENVVVKMILDETIDDVIAQLGAERTMIDDGKGGLVAMDNQEEDLIVLQNRVVIEGINDLIDIINFKMAQMRDETLELIKDYDGDYKKEIETGEADFYARKHFGARNKREKCFPLAMSVINRGSNLIEKIKEEIGKKTNNLMQARKWIENAEEEYKQR